MSQNRMKIYIILFAITLLVFLVISPISVQSTSASFSGAGERPEGPAGPLSPSALNINQSLSQVISEYGKIKLSMDALGTVESSGDIHVDKPAGATVRKAYLLSATTGFDYYELASGDVTLLGNIVVWNKEITSSIGSYNYWADVTAVIKPTIDAAPTGQVNIAIGENNSSFIDGEILVVIFDDPNQTQDTTVLLYFGAQNVSGDSFIIDFSVPINKSDPNLVLDYSLGISYSYQVNGVQQYSIVDINGNRLTTAAGGEDDGSSINGALITVGGFGDTNDNPADPNSLPIDQFSDDELYNLIPFVNNGDSSVTINTSNPSIDDNILFASLTSNTPIMNYIYLPFIKR